MHACIHIYIYIYVFRALFVVRELEVFGIRGLEQEPAGGLPDWSLLAI